MKSSKVKIFRATLIFCIVIFSACGIKSDDLIGRWNYVAYEYANKSLQKPLADIATQKPYIEFAKDGKCKIVSSAKVLSEGTYHLENKIIRYTETLGNGQKRAIPFLIKSLTDQELVFQTMDAEVKVITGVKE